MKSDLPKFLYHYTTIESLAMILKNRTIRFNNLVDLDDLEEGRSLDIEDPGRLTYASCWTKSSAEHIPLWFMYSKNMEGVRIKLPTNPFGPEPRFIGNNIFAIDEEKPLFIKAEKPDQYRIMYRKKFIGDAVLRLNNDLKIEYTDDEKKIMPVLLSESVDKKSQTITILGRIKRSCWSFQKECRYIITVIPEIDIKSKIEKGHSEAWKEAYSNSNMISFKNLFLQIEETAFQKMGIMMGPGVSEGQRTILEDLINKYNPKAKLVPSKLTGKIRI